VDRLSRLPAAHRRRIGTPRDSGTLGPYRQAVLVPRWFRAPRVQSHVNFPSMVGTYAGRQLHIGLPALINPRKIA
jgi:hypothetical protein